MLTGTLPHLSQQNVFLGLPLVLMPEELVLLVEKREWLLPPVDFGNLHTHPHARVHEKKKKELAMIVHDPAVHHTPTPSQLETWDASRRQDVALQLARLEQRKAEDRALAASAVTTTATTTMATPAPQDATLAATIQQKRAEREARRRQLAAAATGGGTSDVTTVSASGASIRGSDERERDGAAPASNNNANANAVYTVSVPTTSDTFAWYDYNNSNSREHDDPDPQQQQPQQQAHTSYVYETLDAARTARVWVYPSSAEERARCEVFRDLWEKGYFMGGGSKFGGDWLVYPGGCCTHPNSPARNLIILFPFSPPTQAIRCAIIRTLLPPCNTPRLPR